MSKIENGGLDQYGTEPFEQQQSGTTGVEGVNTHAELRLVATCIHGFKSYNNVLQLYVAVKQLGRPT